MSQLSDFDAALVDALLAISALTDIVGEAIYNGIVPATDAEVYPRITIGGGTDRDALSGEGAAFRTTTRVVSETVHLWSREGRHELLAMYNAVFTLHKQNVASGAITGYRVEWVSDVDDPDGQTLHAIVKVTGTLR